MKRGFVNPVDGRIRAGWRILLFVIGLVALALVGQLVLKTALGGIPEGRLARDWAAIGLAALAATIAVPLARRFVDRKSLVSLGLKVDRRAIADLVFGFLLSAAMAGSIFLAMSWTGLIEITGFAWNEATSSGPGGSTAAAAATFGVASLVSVFLLHVVVSWWEELVFRGYLLQNMMEGIGTMWAVAVSCLLYGLVHAGNPNAGLLSTAIIVLFGYLRIYGYLATGLLWLSMGMHLGWNFFQGPVFGFAASGRETGSLIVQDPVGPAWLSGGAFGPEGSVLTIPVLVLAVIAMRWWSSRSLPSLPKRPD